MNIGDTEIKKHLCPVLLEMMYLCCLAQNTKQKKLKVFTIDEAYIILASYLNNPF
jgi:hypothetical protein